MTFEGLREFLVSKMRMSHIYQPLLIKTLIDSGGAAMIRQLAIVFLAHDESRISYYEDRLERMPVPVLSRHGVVRREGDLVVLDVDNLTLAQRAELKAICERKIQEFITRKGLATWDLRASDAEPVPDSLRYRVIKDARGRCALRGATRDEEPLAVAHIIPPSRGGKTTYENLQVLCERCLRSRSRHLEDDTDFRTVPGDRPVPGCVFCDPSGTGRSILSNAHAYAVLDRYPVTKGHTLVIPRRHFADYFEMTRAECEAVHDLLRVRRSQLLDEDPSILGFNIGVNPGEAAGQTVMHCHVHLTPRRQGDTEDRRGGVRGVIPGKMGYA